MNDKIIEELVTRYPVLKTCLLEVSQACQVLLNCFQTDHKLLVCGKGGSASDAEHIAGELLKSLRFKRRVSDLEFKRNFEFLFSSQIPQYLEDGFPVIPLVSQGAFISAFCNDVLPEGVFAQQVFVYGRPNDVLMILSTSGNSLNCIEAAKVAKARLMKVIALTGERTSSLSEIADITIRVPKRLTHEIQELHLPVYHAICAVVEQRLCDEK